MTMEIATTIEQSNRLISCGINPKSLICAGLSAHIA